MGFVVLCGLRIFFIHEDNIRNAINKLTIHKNLEAILIIIIEIQQQLKHDIRNYSAVREVGIEKKKTERKTV